MAADNITSTDDMNVVIDTSDMYVNEKGEYFEAIILNQNGTPISNESVVFNINSVDYNRITNDLGMARIQINLNPGNYTISTISGNAVVSNTIFVRDSNTVFVKPNATNDEIQQIIDSAAKGSIIEFTGKQYGNISLTITKQPVTLVSYGGTTLNGVKDKSIISITGVDVGSTQVLGLNLAGGKTGIHIGNVAPNVVIANNTVSNCVNGIFVDGAIYTDISNNKILNCENNAIHLKDAYGTNIINNTINKNTNGIYFDQGNKLTNIVNNTLEGSSFNAISLDKSGEFTNILSNRIVNNRNGVFVNCNAEELNLQYNEISYNSGDGIDFGADYRKTDDGKDANIEDNVVADNEHMNILGSDSIYIDINLGKNWVGTDIRAFSSVCAKIKMTFYSLKITQTSPGSIDISIGPSSLPSYVASLSFDGGKTWQAVTITGGNAVVNVANGDGKVVVRTDGPTQSFTLEDYVPYQPPKEPETPVEPVKPVEPVTNGTQDSGSDSESGSGAGVAGGESVSEVGNANEELGAAASAAATEAVTEVATEDTSSTSESSTASESPASSSNSVSKAINVDEDTVRILGMGAILVLFILVIAGYYRKDIETMINNKKGS